MEQTKPDDEKKGKAVNMPLFLETVKGTSRPDKELPEMTGVEIVDSIAVEDKDNDTSGYATISFPHLLWQPGSVMLLRLVVLAATSDNGRSNTHRTRKTRYISFVANRGKDY